MALPVGLTSRLIRNIGNKPAGIIDVWQVDNLPNIYYAQNPMRESVFSYNDRWVPNVYYAQNPIRFNNDIVRESVK